MEADVKLMIAMEQYLTHLVFVLQTARALHLTYVPVRQVLRGCSAKYGPVTLLIRVTHQFVPQTVRVYYQTFVCAI